MTPSKSLRYGLGAWVEIVTVAVPLIMSIADVDPFGWRRTRVMDSWATVFVVFVALIMIPTLLVP